MVRSNVVPGNSGSLEEHVIMAPLRLTPGFSGQDALRAFDRDRVPDIESFAFASLVMMCNTVCHAHVLPLSIDEPPKARNRGGVPPARMVVVY